MVTDIISWGGLLIKTAPAFIRGTARTRLRDTFQVVTDHLFRRIIGKPGRRSGAEAHLDTATQALKARKAR